MDYWTNGICGTCQREHVTVTLTPMINASAQAVRDRLEFFEEIEGIERCKCRPSEWKLAQGPATRRHWTSRQDNR